MAEHVALLYRQRMEGAVGMPLPNLPNVRDPKFKLDDTDPQMDMLISQRAAQVVAQAPQMAPIRALQQMGQQGQGQQGTLQYAKQLAELEAQALQQRTQAEIAADQAKAQSDIQIDQAKAQQQLDINQQKSNAELQAKIAKLEADLQIEREKNAAKLQMEMMKDARNNRPNDI
jgi:hypothetical protein